MIGPHMLQSKLGGGGASGGANGGCNGGVPGGGCIGVKTTAETTMPPFVEADNAFVNCVGNIVATIVVLTRFDCVNVIGSTENANVY